MDTCVDCKSSKGKAPLECKCHQVCSKCLIKRATERDPHETIKCSECSSVTGSEGIYIFVDDSNIWIEAKKLYAKKSKFRTSEDPRVRIDMGKLADVVADGRPVEQGILYGSEPPPVDTVWKKIRKKGWWVKSKRRDTRTKREKQIDTEIVADVTALAIRTPVRERTSIVLVTGDSNIKPALEKVLEEEGWKTEVYMWDDALSKQLKVFASENASRVSVVPLDKYLDRLAFTSKQIDVSGENHVKRNAREYGVVFSVDPEAFSKRRIPPKPWYDQLESIAQWPCRYYWFVSKTTGQTDDLVIIFQPDPQTGTRFDIAEFMKNMKDMVDDTECMLPHVCSVCSFAEYIELENKRVHDHEIEQFDKALEEVGIIDKNDIDPVSTDVAVSVCEVSDEESEWIVVKHRFRPRQQKFSDPCHYGKHCTRGTQYSFKHTDEDKAYFKQRPGGKGNPYRKVKLCYNIINHGKCWKSADDCDGAHGEEDAHCLACGADGHFTSNCHV